MHSAVGFAAIRCIALTGARRGEVQHLKWEEVDANGTCLALGETKTGASLRPLSRAAFDLIDAQPSVSDYLFPSRPNGAGYRGLPGLWRTVQRTAKTLKAKDVNRIASADGPLDHLTLHSLRHSFAGTAEPLGATIPTIAALLGHRLGGVTGGYILKRVDVLLIDAANRVAEHIEMLMRGEAPASNVVQFVPRGRYRGRDPAEALAA